MSVEYIDNTSYIHLGGSTLILYSENREEVLNSRKKIICNFLAWCYKYVDYTYTITSGNPIIQKQESRMICANLHFITQIYAHGGYGRFDVLQMWNAHGMMKNRYIVGIKKKPPAFTLVYHMPEFCNLYEYGIICTTNKRKRYIGDINHEDFANCKN